MITATMIAAFTNYMRLTYAICLVIVIIGVALAIRRKLRQISYSISARKVTKRRRATSVAPTTTEQ